MTPAGLSPEREAEIRARLENATLWPWDCDHNNPHSRWWDVYQPTWTAPAGDGDQVASVCTEADARFVADAPQAITDLLSALDHARSQLAAEREAGRQEGLRQAAAALAHPNAGLVPPDGGDPTPREVLDNCRDDILALLPAEVKDGK